MTICSMPVNPEWLVLSGETISRSCFLPSKIDQVVERLKQEIAELVLRLDTRLLRP